jgi:hypothetical protein
VQFDVYDFPARAQEALFPKDFGLISESLSL